MAFIAVSLQMFWQKCYRNVPWVVLYETYEFCANHWIWLVAMAKFANKYSKIISSEAIRGMKLKLCRNVHNIRLYISYDFCSRCSCAFIAMTTLFPLTYNGKSEKKHLLLSQQIFWQRFYRHIPWVVLYETYEFCPNRWIWLVAMATKRINSRKNIKKSSPQKPSRTLLHIKVTPDLHLTYNKNGGNLGLVLKMKNIACISVLLTKHVKYSFLYLFKFVLYSIVAFKVNW